MNVFNVRAGNSPNEILWRGLYTLDPSLVTDAMQRGADVNCEHKKKLPIERIIYGYGPDDKKQNVPIIFSILLNSDKLDLFKRNEYDWNLAEQLLNLDNPYGNPKGTYFSSGKDEYSEMANSFNDMIAQVLIKTINEFAKEGKDYEVNFDGIFKFLGSPDNPKHKVRVIRATQIQKILDTVRDRLNNAKTPEEQNLNDKFPDIAKKWKDGLKVPPLDQLATPSQAAIDSLLQLIDCGGKLGSAQEEGNRLLIEHEITVIRNKFREEMYGKRSDDKDGGPKAEPQ